MVTMYDMPAIKRGIFKCAYKALLSSAPQSAFCVGLFRSSAGAAKTVLLIENSASDVLLLSV